MSVLPEVREVLLSLSDEAVQLRRLAQEQAAHETQEALIAAHEAGATQEELAKALKISRQAVAKRLTKCRIAGGCQHKGTHRMRRFYAAEGQPVTETYCARHVEACWRRATQMMQIYARLQMVTLDGNVIEEVTR